LVFHFHPETFQLHGLSGLKALEGSNDVTFAPPLSRRLSMVPSSHTPLCEPVPDEPTITPIFQSEVTARRLAFPLHALAFDVFPSLDVFFLVGDNELLLFSLSILQKTVTLKHVPCFPLMKAY